MVQNRRNWEETWKREKVRAIEQGEESGTLAENQENSRPPQIKFEKFREKLIKFKKFRGKRKQIQEN